MIIHDVFEYIQQDIARPEFYIQDLLTKEGSMIIYGDAGSKKSWLVMYLAYCLATGTDWLGFEIMQTRTLIVNLEISSPVYYWRLRSMSNLFAGEQNMLFECSPGMQFLEEDAAFSGLYEAVSRIQPGVVIIDCFQSAFGGDENVTERVSPFLRNMSRLQNELHSAIILVHHANKNPLATSMGRMRGSTKLPGWTDTVVYLADQPSGSQLQFSKTRNSMHELRNLNIIFRDYNWTVRGQGGNG